MFIWILFLHFFSDFFLQDRNMAEKKSSNWIFLLLHCFTILLIFFFGLMFIKDLYTALLFGLIYSLSHFIQDGIIWKVYKYILKKKLGEKVTQFKYWESSSFYNTIGLDQLLHISVLYVLWVNLYCN